MQNPLTTSKHYSNKNCIILPVHVSSISSSTFLLTQWMNEVPQHFIIQFILVFGVWQTLFLFSSMSSRKRTLSIRVSCPGLFHRGTVTKHGDSITVTHTRKNLGYPPSAPYIPWGAKSCSTFIMLEYVTVCLFLWTPEGQTRNNLLNIDRD